MPKSKSEPKHAKPATFFSALFDTRTLSTLSAWAIALCAAYLAARSQTDWGILEIIRSALAGLTKIEFAAVLGIGAAAILIHAMQRASREAQKEIMAEATALSGVDLRGLLATKAPEARVDDHREPKLF